MQEHSRRRLLRWGLVDDEQHRAPLVGPDFGSFLYRLLCWVGRSSQYTQAMKLTLNLTFYELSLAISMEP